MEKLLTSTPNLKKISALRMLKGKIEHHLALVNITWEEICPLLEINIPLEVINKGSIDPEKFLHRKEIVALLDASQEKKLSLHNLGKKLELTFHDQGVYWEDVFPRLFPVLELESMDAICNGAKRAVAESYLSEIVARSMSPDVIKRVVSEKLMPLLLEELGLDSTKEVETVLFDALERTSPFSKANFHGDDTVERSPLSELQWRKFVDLVMADPKQAISAIRVQHNPMKITLHNHAGDDFATHIYKAALSFEGAHTNTSLISMLKDIEVSLLNVQV
jgi:hypothetical protein